ncbi:hypothetical protein A3736_02265 [Erythrobacter sp. HI0063]|nr:hypothetical protein A3736_02265 [Erythrobacter sp. HI0063]
MVHARQPVLAQHRALVLHIGSDHAGLDDQTVGNYQPFGHGALPFRLEKLAQRTAVVETPVAFYW